MGRISTTGEFDALDRLAQEFDAIKRQFSQDDRLRMLASRSVTLKSAPADIAIDDWDDLFDAVKARLRLAVSESRRGAGAGASFQTSVLECAAALDQLHTMLHVELGRRRRVELDAVVVPSAVAPAGLTGRAGAEAAQSGPLHDGLATSVPHRDLFRQRLDHLLDLAAPVRPALALLYLDLDGFQPLTDRYGLEAADELLRIVEARLVRAAGAQAAVSYLGADEFACLRADGTDRKQVSQLACTLFDAVSVPLKIGQLAISVRPSIGIAVCPDDGSTSATLLQRADAAMMRAKRQQTGYAFFDQRTDR